MEDAFNIDPSAVVDITEFRSVTVISTRQDERAFVDLLKRAHNDENGPVRNVSPVRFACVHGGSAHHDQQETVNY